MRLGARLWWGVIPLAVLLWGVGALSPVVFPGLGQTPVAVLALVPAVLAVVAEHLDGPATGGS